VSDSLYEEDVVRARQKKRLAGRAANCGLGWEKGSFAVTVVPVAGPRIGAVSGVTVAAMVAIQIQDAKEGLSGVGLLCAGDEFRRTLRDDTAAAFAAFRAKIDDPVSLLDDVKVMLDDEHSVAERNQTLQNVEQFANIVKMQARGGLIKDIQGAASLAFGKFAGKFDALGFAAGEGSGGLAESDVAEANFNERGKLLLNLRNIFEELEGVYGREI
jgi:hypothetical protein